MKVEQETMYAAALQSLKGCGSRRLRAGPPRRLPLAQPGLGRRLG